MAQTSRRRYVGVVAIKDYVSSTSDFYRVVDDGLILKSAHPGRGPLQGNRLMSAEKRILERLVEHPRIVKYRGFRDRPNPRGLLFCEANRGNLQNYIDRNNDSICLSTRKKWCRQVTEAVEFLHALDIIHSDLIPENCLLHQSKSESDASSPDILLADFGGSTCRDLDIVHGGTGCFPNPPFWDLWLQATTGTDIFSLGSVFYTVMTGHWPYKSKSSRLDSSSQDQDQGEGESREQYQKRCIDLLMQGVFPDLRGITAGNIIMGCWKKQFSMAEHILAAAQDTAQF